MRFLTNLIIAVVMTQLFGCGQSDDIPASDYEPSRAELEAVWDEAQIIVEDELAKVEARSAVRFPCTLFDQAAASELLASELEAPGFASEHKTHNDESWQADACSWISWGSGPSMSVWVSRPAHFADGRVRCFGMNDDDETGTSHGGRSSWFYRDSFAWGRLLVCRDDVLFEIEVHGGPAEEVAVRELIGRVARGVVDSLDTGGG